MKRREQARFIGRLKIRELPKGCELADFCAWWPHLSEKERERYTVYEMSNILTQNGRNQILTYISLGGGVSTGFASFFSVGTASITSVYPGDTAVQGELYRSAPNSNTIVGNQIDISTFFGSVQAVGTYTNAGLYGGSTATATLGTGTLYTHTLYSYTKLTGTAITNDYLITLN
jgi:hypothetical protein